MRDLPVTTTNRGRSEHRLSRAIDGLKGVAVAALAAGGILCAGSANATPFTSTSPSGFDVTTVGASTVGGIVVVLTGNNGARVVSQLAASTLFAGYAPGNPLLIGSQAGFGDSVTGALGGGLSRAEFRFTLFDGDTGTGNFDEDDNSLLVNDLLIGNWSDVNAENTDASGNAAGLGLSGGGFRNNTLDTGWFSTTNAVTLASLFSAIDAADGLTFKLDDVDDGDNEFNFTLGINASLINVGSGPVVNPPTGPNTPVPAPSSLALAGGALIAGFLARRRRRD